VCKFSNRLVSPVEEAKVREINRYIKCACVITKNNNKQYFLVTIKYIMGTVQYYSVKVELLPVHDNVNALCIS